MKELRKTMVFVMLLALGLKVGAQTSGEVVPKLELTLEQAKNYALDNNVKLQNAGLDVKMAEAKRWQAIATMLPQGNVKFDYQNMLGYEMVFGSMGGAAIAMPASGTLSATASMAISGSQIVGALLNNVAVEMSDISKKKTKQEVIYATTSIYMSILAMEQTTDLLEQNYSNLDDLYNITLNSVKVGAAEQTAADQISVQVSSLESAINSTKRNVQMLYSSLALQLGCGVDSEIVLTQKLDEILNIDEVMDLMFTQFDITQNYDYQLLSKNTQLAKQQVTLAAMDFVPSLTAAYVYSYKKYFSNKPTMNMTPPHMFMVSLNIPILSSGQRIMKVKEKKFAKLSAENTQKDTEDALQVQDKQLRFNLSTAYENYNTQKKNIDVSQRIFQSTTNKFEQGYASNLELTNASTTLLTAQSNYVAALLEIVNAHIALKQLLNK